MLFALTQTRLLKIKLKNEKDKNVLKDAQGLTEIVSVCFRVGLRVAPAGKKQTNLYLKKNKQKNMLNINQQ